jgi:hypothetical protein
MILICFFAILHALLFGIVITDNYIKKRFFFLIVKLNWEDIETVNLPFSKDNKTFKFILTSKDGRRIIINFTNINKGVHLIKVISEIIEKKRVAHGFTPLIIT